MENHKEVPKNSANTIKKEAVPGLIDLPDRWGRLCWGVINWIRLAQSHDRDYQIVIREEIMALYIT
jgi:hypothetical protein